MPFLNLSVEYDTKWSNEMALVAKYWLYLLRRASVSHGAKAARTSRLKPVVLQAWPSGRRAANLMSPPRAGESRRWVKKSSGNRESHPSPGVIARFGFGPAQKSQLSFFKNKPDLCFAWSKQGNGELAPKKVQARPRGIVKEVLRKWNFFELRIIACFVNKSTWIESG